MALVILIMKWVNPNDNPIQNFEKIATDMKSELGSRVVISGDTLIVVDYKMWGATYVLSDRSEINKALLDKVKIK